MQSISSAMHSEKRAKHGADASRHAAVSLRERQRLERKEEYLVRDEICWLLEEVPGAIESREEGFLPNNPYLRMKVELFREEFLGSFAECMRGFIFAK